MGGKTATTTQSVSIPPEVLARYRSVNERAENVAATPFQPYSYDPSAFVAPLTPTQVAGIQNINTMQGAGFPFYGAGTQMTAAGAAPVGPITGSDIGRYYNPFTAAVAAPTYEALRQQQAQEMQGATANAIRSGAFGGDRSGLVAANLARQQQLGTSQAMAPIFQQAYGQAQEAAQRQQQVDLQNQARMLQAGQQMAGLGTGLQQLGISGAQAQLAAGTAEQQTQQAGLQALYNQFLQQVGYPFQVAQFLANIAMGTGALSGSTTTTTQPAPFFSDRREKTNVKKLGNGLYAFDYKDDVEAAEREGKPMPPKRVGPMAQEIEKDKPGMVIDVNDYKVVDPGREKAAYGGLMSFMNSLPQDLQQQSMGGGVTPEMAGQGYARGGYIAGGVVSGEDLRGLMRQAENPLEFYGGLKNKAQGVVGAAGYVPKASLHVPRLATASSSGLRAPEPVVKQGMEVLQGLTGKSGLGPQAQEIYRLGQVGLNKAREVTGSDTANQPAAGATKASFDAGQANTPEGFNIPGGNQDYNMFDEISNYFAQGGVVPRHGYATDGSVNEPDDDSPISAYSTPGPGLQIPDELKNKYEMLKPEKPPQQQSSGLGEVLGLAKMGAQIAMGMPPFFADGGVVPRAGYQAGGDTEFEPDPTLIQSESGGNFGAENKAVGAGGLRGHFGRAQFGQARLQDAVRAGVLPEGITPQQFKADPDLQRATEKWHFGDIENFIKQRELDRFVGSEIAGIPVTQQGLVNVAHLGGKGGLQKFVETGGRYNPEDENRTRLSDYLAMGARGSSITGQSEPRAARTGVAAGVETMPAEGSQEAQAQYNIPGQRSTGVAPIGRESSIGDIANRILPEGIPTSQQFWVPTLSFLGKMLSSKSPYLLGAVGEGLAGGVEGYTTLQKNELEAAKAVMDLLKDRFTRTVINGVTVFYDTRTGRRLNANEYQSIGADILRAQGINPARYGFGVSPPAAPISGRELRPATQEQRKETVQETQTPSPEPISAPGERPKTPAVPSEQPKTTGTGQDWLNTPPDEANAHLIGKNPTELERYAERWAEKYGLEGERNPKNIRATIKRLRDEADNLQSTGVPSDRALAENLRVQASEELKRLDALLKSATVLQVERNKDIQSANTKASGEYQAEVEKRGVNYTKNREMLTALADINSKFVTGRSTALQAELADWASRFLPNGPSVGKMIGDAASFDLANKIAVTQAFDVVNNQNLSRAPAAGLIEGLKTVPGPTLSPAAAYELIGRGVGTLDYSHARDKEFTEKAYPRNMRPGQFLINWEKDKNNSIDKFIGRAFNEIPVGAGVDMRQLEDIARRYPGYTVKPVERKRTEQPAQRPAQQPAQTPAQQPAQPSGKTLITTPPEIGSVVDGYRYKGGNPNSETSWEKVK